MGRSQRESFQAKSDYVGQAAAGRGPSDARERHRGAGEHRRLAARSCSTPTAARSTRSSPAATAFVHRNVLFCIQYLSYNGGGSWLYSDHAKMQPYVTGGAYFNYTDPDLKHWQSAYYGSNYRRLQAIRRAVDPHHYFNFPQAIGR